QRTGVRHRLVEHELEELVAQVVVGADVLTVGFPLNGRVGAPVPAPVERIGHGADEAPDAVSDARDAFEVAEEEAYERGGVCGVSPAVDVAAPDPTGSVS